jgi:hypothetical protein
VDEAGKVCLDAAEVAEQAVAVLAQAPAIGLQGRALGIGPREHLLGRLASGVQARLGVLLGAGPQPLRGLLDLGQDPLAPVGGLGEALAPVRLDLLGALLGRGDQLGRVLPGLPDDRLAAFLGLLDQHLGGAPCLVEHPGGLGSEVLERRRRLVAQRRQLALQVGRRPLGLVGADALLVETRGQLVDVGAHLLALAAPEGDVEGGKLAGAAGRPVVRVWLEHAHGVSPENGFWRAILAPGDKPAQFGPLSSPAAGQPLPPPPSRAPWRGSGTGRFSAIQASIRAHQS